jgi:uncharacterized protein
MRYNVAQLLKGATGAVRQYDLDEEIRNLDPELVPLAHLIGTVTLMRSSQGILVTGMLRTTLEGQCRRCLDSCAVDVELELEEEFYPAVRIADVPLDPVPEEDRDEALLIDEHHILDLSEVIRQGLWLSRPMETLCRPGCAGLCPTCGGNRNLGECSCDSAAIDPRWATLQSLLADGSEQELVERSY